MEITLTEEMRRAVNLINTTSCPVFITGKAGTGKTTLLKYLVNNVEKRFVVTASTGIAAINAGGVTLHSFLGIPMGVLGPFDASQARLPKHKITLLRNIDVLIIDEVSMVRPDVLDYIDSKLKHYRKSHEPFGGVQVVMFGDLFQLPPVVPGTELTALKCFYPGVYFFYADVFKKSGFHVVELTHIFRQSDDKFIRILNNLRAYSLTDEDIDELAEIRDKTVAADFTSKALHICSLKKDVQRINDELLGEPTHTFEAKIVGAFNPKHAICDMKLELREGARVMLLINDRDQGFSNGTLGFVQEIKPESIMVRLDSGKYVTVAKHAWTSYEYEVVDGNVNRKETGSCIQFPVTLAWAITIHKSQGLTFDNVVIHAKNVFAPGQMYVALSRCRSLEGIVTDSFVTRKHIRPDSELLAFEKAYRSNNYFFNRDTLKKITK